MISFKSFESDGKSAHTNSISSHLCKIQWKSAKLLRQTKVCLKKLCTKLHSISICMNFDIFKGILTCLLTIPINISFTTKCYFYTLLEQDVPFEWYIHLKFELNFALAHQQFKLILNIRLSALSLVLSSKKSLKYFMLSMLSFYATPGQGNAWLGLVAGGK